MVGDRDHNQFGLDAIIVDAVLFSAWDNSVGSNGK